MPERKRFAILLPSLKFGGAERVAINLARGLQGRGWVVDILLMSFEGELLDEARAQFDVIDLRCDRTWKLPFALLRYARLARPTAILSSFWKLNICACLARIGCPSFRLGVWEHSPPSASANSPTRVYGITASIFYRLATRVIVVSSGVEKDVRSITFGLGDRIQRIFNPVLLGEAHPGRTPDGTARIIWVGRLDGPKNPLLVLDAFALLDPALNATLTVVGDGPLMTQMRGKVSELKSTGVELLGFRPDVEALMNDADLLVLSSDREGLPTVLIEALGAGLRIAATDCTDGIRDILGKRHGTIVPKGDARLLARGIEREFRRGSDPGEQRSRARMFDPSVIAAEYEAALKLSDAPL